MTALALVKSIFARAQTGVEWNVRRVTAEQARYLRGLLDREGQETRPNGPGTFVWDAPGRWSYELKETAEGRWTLTRLGNAGAGTAGDLF